MLSVGLSGLYGLFMSISADQVFLFVVFGSLLGIFKVEGLLMEAGKILGRACAAGPGSRPCSPTPSSAWYPALLWPTWPSRAPSCCRT